MRGANLLAAVLLCTAAFPAFAADSGAYKAPRNGLGQPDLGGTWSNATLTPQSRAPLFGTRAAYTKEEAQSVEHAQQAVNEKGNAKSDLSVALNSSDNVGAYNQGWIDGGSQVMRVHGEPRTSLLTTPDGQVPAKKGEPPHVLPANAGSVAAGQEAVRIANSRDVFVGQGATGGQAAALRAGQFDMLVTDVDMPRMNGIELVRMVRSEARFASLPIAIVSYKDRAEDRAAGMDAGANAYLTKGSFQDQTFITTVNDLIGDSVS